MDKSQIHPIKDNIIRQSDHILNAAYEDGLEILADGKVACLILAGGDASRLGANIPKGMFNPKIDEIHSIFELITLKVKKIEQLCRERFPYSPDLGRDRVVLIIMTNQENYGKITEFFKQNDFFGYKTTIFFPQSHLPVIDQEGQILLKSEDQILFAPNGNGSVFPSMLSSGLLDRLIKWGVEYLHLTSVDNILNKWADPKMVGLCAQDEIEVVCKYTPKKHALERVGVFAINQGRPYVIEYSMIGDEMAKSTDESGQLLFNHSSILNFMFRLSFLKREILNDEFLHLLDEKCIVAVKDVKNYDPTTKQIIDSKGCKFEIIAQESLTYCPPKKFLLLECLRNEEFAPIKNSVKEDFDNPETALDLYCGYHQQLLEKAGCQFEGRSSSPEKADHLKTCFIHPRVSYDGENIKIDWPAISLPFSLK